MPSLHVDQSPLSKSERWLVRSIDQRTVLSQLRLKEGGAEY